MIRRIHCEKCGFPPALHPEDAAQGWKRRLTCIIAHKPANHGITVTEYEHGKKVSEKREELPALRCDLCGKPIQDGEKAIASTMWRGDQEGEPGNWEQEYGKPVDSAEPVS